MKKAFFLFFLFFIQSFLGVTLFSQTINLSIHPVDSISNQERKQFDNLKGAYDYLIEKKENLIESGYLSASIDSISLTDSVFHAWLFTGAKYKWASLSFQQVPKLLWDNLQIAQNDWNGKTLSPKKFLTLNEKIIRYYEQNGYPFAATFLDSISQSNAGVNARFNINPGPLMKIDSVLIVGDIEVASTFITNYIGIHPGDLYDESKIKNISKRLNELSFLQQAKPWKIDFTIDKNKLYLYLRDKKANQLNGLIGLQPNTAATGKFLLTADFLLSLKNSLGFGETINVIYQNLQYKSPRFNANVLLPYVLGTQFGIDGSFDLYKKDTTYRKTSFELGIRYQLNFRDYIKVVYQDLENRLITPDTQFVRKNKKLPENLDIQAKGFGLELSFDKTDYKLNPRKGWTARASGSGLLRKVIKNDALISIDDNSGFDYSALYDQANQEKYQYRISGKINYFLTLYKNFVVMLDYDGGYISGHHLFQNELFQLGGFKLLRGFDEQSIYANQYHVGTIELRAILSQNSYFYLFNDNSFISTQFESMNRKSYPVSVGMGVSLENKGGLFNIALGLGKMSGQNFEFRTARVHFGYAAYF